MWDPRVGERTDRRHVECHESSSTRPIRSESYSGSMESAVRVQRRPGGLKEHRAAAWDYESGQPRAADSRAVGPGTARRRDRWWPAGAKPSDNPSDLRWWPAGSRPPSDRHTPAPEPSHCMVGVSLLVPTTATDDTQSTTPPLSPRSASTDTVPLQTPLTYSSAVQTSTALSHTCDASANTVSPAPLTQSAATQTDTSLLQPTQEAPPSAPAPLASESPPAPSAASASPDPDPPTAATTRASFRLSWEEFKLFPQSVRHEALAAQEFDLNGRSLATLSEVQVEESLFACVFSLSEPDYDPEQWLQMYKRKVQVENKWCNRAAEAAADAAADRRGERQQHHGPAHCAWAPRAYGRGAVATRAPTGAAGRRRRGGRA